MSGEIRHRRKLGKLISKPISFLNDSPDANQVILYEEDNAAARKTRAAALMYINRNNMDLTTSVKDNAVWIMKDKDIIGEGYEVFLGKERSLEAIFNGRK